MNKKRFASATALAVVAGAVVGAVYYRHVVVRQLDRWLHDEDEALTEGGDPVPVRPVNSGAVSPAYQRLQEHLDAQ